MSDSDARVVALLHELVDLQRTANEQQLQALQRTDQYYADARARSEAAIELQKVAIGRQRWFVRVWLGLTVFIVACIAGVLIAASRYLH